MEADAHRGEFVFISMYFREKMKQSCSDESFRDKSNMRLVVLHQWEELGSPFLFSLLLSPSHPPLSPLLCIAGESPQLSDDCCSAESALWWTNINIIKAA